MVNKGILFLYCEKILRSIFIINKQLFKLYKFNIFRLYNIKLYNYFYIFILFNVLILIFGFWFIWFSFLGI